MTRYRGNLISGLMDLATKNAGAQLKLGEAPRAYRVEGENGGAVLCDRHIDLARGAGYRLAVTGATFPAALCDDCLIEAKKEHEL